MSIEAEKQRGREEEIQSAGIQEQKIEFKRKAERRKLLGIK